MKKAIPLLKMAAIFFCLMTGTVFGAERAVIMERMPEKVYIDSQNIQIVDNNIVVYLHNNWVAVNGIHSDSRGLYIRPDSALGFWVCPYCHTLNPPWRIICSNCQR